MRNSKKEESNKYVNDVTEGRAVFLDKYLQDWVPADEADLSMAVFHKDPCGLICLFITYSAVFYADYCIVQHVVRPTLTER